MVFQDYQVNFLLTGLFLFAIISFAVGISGNYGHSEDFVKDEKIDFTDIQTQVESTNEQAESWEKSFRSDNLFVALGSIVLFSVWGIIKLMWVTTIGMYNVIIQGATNVLGIPAMVTATITTILIVGLIFSAWRFIKAGE